IAALCPFQHALQQLFNQEAVHLEKRKVAHAKRKSTSLVRQVAGAGKLEALLALIEQQQAFQLRERRLEIVNQIFGRLGKTLERDVQRQLGVLRIHECFNFQNSGGQGIGARQFLQLPECLDQARRQHGTLVNGYDMRALRQKIAKGARQSVAIRPLSAVAVTV